MFVLSSSTMEVDAGQINGLVNGIDEQVDEQSLSAEFSDDYDVFSDPDFPRVGEEYQVEIPPLISESDYSLFQSNTLKFQVGLPIPIIWIKDGAEDNKCDPLTNECKSIGVISKIESPKLECVKESQKGLDCEKKLNPKLDAIESTLSNRVKLGELENSDVQQEIIGHCLVPGSASATWTEIEEAGFILGLYIFGKNFVQVKTFVGNKNMGDILSFYYGKFYKSDKYQRWSGGRKVKNKKYISGQKFFTGPRQQELLSRLLPNVSEECRCKLLEVSKTFIEGKMLLGDYVLTLKASVGLKALVEAVGIGRGKEDLTSLTVHSVKSSQAVPVRKEIPVGKACSMLTYSEIISFLTGDCRLSKTRASDLFWEAVWPRLLARGWHSEQPGSYNYAAVSKNPLVFLVPGVKKFSRKLVKGNHYFDSVTDVLGKVASDPELIDLETNADTDCTNREGNEWTKDTKSDHKISPEQPRHFYLKVKTPNRSTDVMKFTVVDTSLASEKVAKVRELRSLPFGVLKACTFESDSDDEDTSEEETNEIESESVNATCFDNGKNDITKATKFNIGMGASSDLNGFKSNPSKEELPRSNMVCTSLSAALINQKTDISGKTRKRDGVECQSHQRMVSDNKDDPVPITKRRRRLTACSRAMKNSNTANFFVVPRVKQEDVSFCLGPDNSKYSENVIADFVAPRVKKEKASYCTPCNSKSSNNVHSGVVVVPPCENNSSVGFPTQEIKTLADPLSNSSSIICKEAAPDTSSSSTKEQHQKPQPRTMIDLNLPFSPEVDVDEPFVNEVTEVHKSDTRKELGDLNVGTNFKPVDHSDQQPDIHARRTSTRNRPPTTKVLEAFAFGYLDRKEKRKSRDNSEAGPSRRISRKVTGSSNGGADASASAGSGSSSGDAGFVKEERTDVVSNGHGSTSNNIDVLYTSFKC